MRERDVNKKLFHRGHWEIIAARIREQLSKYMYNDFMEHNDIRVMAYCADTVIDLTFAFVERFKQDNDEFDPVIFLTRCSPNSEVFDLVELYKS